MDSLDTSDIKRPTTIGVLSGPSMSFWERQTAYNQTFDGVLLYFPVRVSDSCRRVQCYAHTVGICGFAISLLLAHHA
jgi:hypothetical protein